LDDWKPYEDLSDYEKEDSGYESGVSGSNWRTVGWRRGWTKNSTTGVNTIGHMHRALPYTAFPHDINQA